MARSKSGSLGPGAWASGLVEVFPTPNVRGCKATAFSTSKSSPPNCRPMVPRRSFGLKTTGICSKRVGRKMSNGDETLKKLGRERQSRRHLADRASRGRAAWRRRDDVGRGDDRRPSFQVEKLSMQLRSGRGTAILESRHARHDLATIAVQIKDLDRRVGILEDDTRAGQGLRFRGRPLPQ